MGLFGNVSRFVSEHLFKPVEKGAVRADVEALDALRKENAALRALYTDTLVKAERPAYKLENPVKDKLAAGVPVYGGFVASSDPMFTEIMGQAGLDYVFIDAEHTTMGPPEVANHIRAAKAEGVVPIVRVPENGVEAVKKYIDAGPLGVIVPNIRTVDDAKQAVAAVKYGPQGGRHVGLGRASGYSAQLAPYLEQANDKVLVGLMGEHADFARNIDQILSEVPGVDFITVGPQDMAASLGLRGQPGHPEVQRHIAMIEDGARRHGVPMGASVASRAQAEQMLEKGYRFFTGPSDFEPIIKAAKEFAEPATLSSGAKVMQPKR